MVWFTIGMVVRSLADGQSQPHVDLPSQSAYGPNQSAPNCPTTQLPNQRWDSKVEAADGWNLLLENKYYNFSHPEFDMINGHLFNNVHMRLSQQA